MVYEKNRDGSDRDLPVGTAYVRNGYVYDVDATDPESGSAAPATSRKALAPRPAGCPAAPDNWPGSSGSIPHSRSTATARSAAA